jgi:hypothetical protein
MRAYTNVVVSMVAGFAGATVAIVLIAGAHTSAADKNFDGDTVTANHLVINGDVVIRSKPSGKPLLLSGPDGAQLSFDHVPGDKNHGSFLVRMGTNLDQPEIVISNLGLGIITRNEANVFTTQVAAVPGIQLSYTDKSGVFPSKAILEVNSLTLMTKAGSPDNVAATLNGSGVTCVDHNKQVACH